MTWSPASLSRLRPRARVLLVRPSGARLFPLGATGGGARDFPADEAGRDALARQLEAAPHTPVRVLVDVTEEDFHHETVPHVHGFARRAMLATRANRWTRGAGPFRVHGEWQERETTGRRDDRLLLSTIAGAERLAPWLDVLRALDAPVAGIHSLPLLSARLLPALGGDAGHGQTLLVTESGVGALRQSLFDDGYLRVSRLATLPSAAPATDKTATEEKAARARAHAISLEIGRVLRYAEHSGHGGAGEMKLRFVGPAPLLAALRECDLPGMDDDDSLVEPAEVARGLRLAGAATAAGEQGIGVDPLFAALVQRHPPPNHYGPGPVLAPYRTRRAAHAIGVAGGILLSASVGWSALAWQSAGEMEAAAARTRQAAQHHEERTRRLPERPEDAPALNELRAVVETAERLEAARVHALPILQTIASAFEPFPAIRLTSLEWFELSERDRWSAPDEEDATTGEFRGLQLRGDLESFDGQARAATDELFRFAKALEAVPGMHAVEVLDFPHGGVGDGYPGAAGRPANFELRMVLHVRRD